MELANMLPGNRDGASHWNCRTAGQWIDAETVHLSIICSGLSVKGENELDIE